MKMAQNGVHENEEKMQENNNESPKIQPTEGNSAPQFTFSPEPTLEQLRQMQSDFVTERGWGKYHTPRNLFLAMTGEVGEVAELLQWRGEVKDGLPDWTAEDKEKMANELSDVFIYLIRLAEKCHVDLPTAAVRKIGLNCKKYPADKVYGSSKKYNEYKYYKDSQ